MKKQQVSPDEPQTESPAEVAPAAPKKLGGARKGSGRKSFRPTAIERKQVEAMAGYGVPIDQIGALIGKGIGSDTMRKYFAPELLAGKAKANAQVGRILFQKAMGGDTIAAIWWSKAQMHWAETQKYAHSGADGAGPIQIVATWLPPA